MASNRVEAAALDLLVSSAQNNLLALVYLSKDGSRTAEEYLARVLAQWVIYETDILADRKQMLDSIIQQVTDIVEATPDRQE